MSRLIFLFAIIVVVYLLIKSYRRNEPVKKQEIKEDMVRCAHCGVHFPIGESLHEGGLHFCCAAHRDARKK